MAYNPNQSGNAAQIAALKQSNVSSYAVISTATTATFGTFYDVTGATSFAVTLPAAPTSGQGVITVKLDAAYSASGVVTITPPGGTTLDGAGTFPMTGPGTEYTFFINAGTTDYKIG
jgi:hypothetical protein